MGEQDVFAFVPHVGIAGGRVAVGYAGTPLMYNCSVFGGPVALASRCAGIRPEETGGERPAYGCSVTFPAADWAEREFEELFPPTKYPGPGGGVVEQPTSWRLMPARTVAIKNMGEVVVREVVDQGIYVPSAAAEDEARRIVEDMRAANRYWPREA